MTFKGEISLGTIIELAMLGATVLGVMRKTGQMEAKLNIMFEWFQRYVIDGDRSRDSDARRNRHGD